MSYRGQWFDELPSASKIIVAAFFVIMWTSFIIGLVIGAICDE